MGFLLGLLGDGKLLASHGHTPDVWRYGVFVPVVGDLGAWVYLQIRMFAIMLGQRQFLVDRL